MGYEGVLKIKISQREFLDSYPPLKHAPCLKTDLMPSGIFSFPTIQIKQVKRPISQHNLVFASF